MAERTILITGAAGGLGKTVVSFFLDKGFRVIATVREELEKKALGTHPLLDVQVVDLSEEEEAQSLVEESLRTYKTIDAALMLVGGFAMGGVADTKGADVRKMIGLNFETAYYIARPLFAQMLRAGKGRLIFIGARPALVPSQGKHALAYALSKSLLFQLAEVLNVEAKGKDVVAHVVVPSTIDTPANRKNMPDADPKTWVTPSQLAEIFHFICTDAAAPLRDPVWKVYNQA
ncbi:SDR family NAD(P)-dependent oxidoreductase [Dinghuibacter silviterrae]|uniref:Short-subunit dehydrogenase n=1 Tax=Dinghuibacter silviterrae TaxID=1539049 RepID=A0A4R8DPT9_9BACT|nr:SDR family NAD(P)-dependent oxidoreductase [Dinghuibacter silviterrae]TDW99140.1 short-subunit dehydrogenase [Dinghuibacter silviterrae]